MKRGFTLIELMLAIALGTLVIYVAVAGIRTASQSITAANRLALENSIIRNGVTIALENTDFWLDHDNPSPFDPPTEQPLRNMVVDAQGKRRGLPFTPFRTSQTDTGYQRLTPPSPPASAPSGVSTVVGNGLDEYAGGWDPNTWQIAEARGWSWGNLCERTPRFQGSRAPASRWVPLQKYKIFGGYEIISSLSPSLSPHHWQMRQLDGLLHSLGAYGMFDYVPANTGLMIYEPCTYPGQAGKWMASAEWCNPDGGPYFRLASDVNLSFTLDRMADTWGNVFLIPNRSVTGANLPQVANRYYGTGIAIGTSANDSSVNNIKQLIADGEQIDNVLHDIDVNGSSNKPANWPSLTVRSLRFMRTGAFINLNRISWFNPMTGKSTEFSFTCFGTTLRGARQQRLRDQPGWCDPFPQSGSPKPNLDSY